MLTIELSGAQALVALLRQIAEGNSPTERELDDVLAVNAYFANFYGQWPGCDREGIGRAIRDSARPPAADTIPARLAEGFRQAASDADVLEARIAWVQAIDPSRIADRVVPFLPDGTPLDTTVHITVDPLNNAFAYRQEMGISLLKGMADRQTFEYAVAHELHHIGFQHWRGQDPVRQRLAGEASGRAVALLHVENLLAEGMANCYLTPHYVFAAEPAAPDDPYQRRLARLRREEPSLFARAKAVLAMCLAPAADHARCLDTAQSLALDAEEFLLPAAHYLGASMVQTMGQAYPREDVVDCARHLADFLPRYNGAASRVGGFVFDAAVVERFGRLWDKDYWDGQDTPFSCIT